jgi:hypothetical protein
MFPLTVACLARILASFWIVMERVLKQDPNQTEVLAELRAREPIFHRSELGTTRADFESMTAEDFWEVGASGRRYSRACVLDELERRHSAPYADQWEISDFHCRRLADETYLVTYTLLQNGVRQTRRSTIWQHTAEGWRILYHQGTMVQDA